MTKRELLEKLKDVPDEAVIHWSCPENGLVVIRRVEGNTIYPTTFIYGYDPWSFREDDHNRDYAKPGVPGVLLS